MKLASGSKKISAMSSSQIFRVDGRTRTMIWSRCVCVIQVSEDGGQGTKEGSLGWTDISRQEVIKLHDIPRQYFEKEDLPEGSVASLE